MSGSQQAYRHLERLFLLIIPSKVAINDFRLSSVQQYDRGGLSGCVR